MSPTGTASADRTFLAHLAPWDAAGLRVGSLRGRERLTAPYRFDVRALTPEVLGPERIPSVGTPMTLALFTEGTSSHAPRFVRGVFTRTQHHGIDHDRDGSWLGLRLEPRLTLLRRRRTRRVFQERTVAQIADMLLAPHRVPWRWAGELPTARIAYAVQYDETDFDFLRRLLARFGVLFFFEQAARARRWSPLCCRFDVDTASSSLPCVHAVARAGRARPSAHARGVRNNCGQRAGGTRRRPRVRRRTPIVSASTAHANAPW